MDEELQYEFEEFKYDIDEGALVFGRYFEEDYYEDEYSHNEIHEYQNKFINMAKDYLHENAPNKYVLTCSYCVFVMTVEEAKSKNIHRYEDFIVR